MEIFDLKHFFLLAAVFGSATISMPLGDLLSCLPFTYLSFHLFRRAPSFRRIKHSEQQQQQKRGGGRSQPGSAASTLAKILGQHQTAHATPA